jgi:hypothetical protein
VRQVSDVQLPAVQLSAFGDGSVRTATTHHDKPGRDFHAGPAQFFSSFEPVREPAALAPTWSGAFAFIAEDRSAFSGALVGVWRAASGGSGPTLEGLVVGTEGTGSYADVAGAGSVTVVWGGHFTGPFDGHLRLTPFAAPRRH